MDYEEGQERLTKSVSRPKRGGGNLSIEVTVTKDLMGKILSIYSEGDRVEQCRDQKREPKFGIFFGGCTLGGGNTSRGED